MDEEKRNKKEDPTKYWWELNGPHKITTTTTAYAFGA